MVTSGSLAAPLSPGRLCFDSPPGALKTPGSPRFTFEFTFVPKTIIRPDPSHVRIRKPITVAGAWLPPIGQARTHGHPLPDSPCPTEPVREGVWTKYTRTGSWSHGMELVGWDGGQARTGSCASFWPRGRHPLVQYLPCAHRNLQRSPGLNPVCHWETQMSRPQACSAPLPPPAPSPQPPGSPEKDRSLHWGSPREYQSD